MGSVVRTSDGAHMLAPHRIDSHDLSVTPGAFKVTSGKVDPVEPTRRRGTPKAVSAMAGAGISENGRGLAVLRLHARPLRDFGLLRGRSIA